MSDDWKGEEPQNFFGYNLHKPTQEELDRYEAARQLAIIQGNINYLKLPIFGETTNCVKCGHVKFKVVFYVYAQLRGTIEALEKVGSNECIVLTCKKCYYSWYEKPMDYKEK